MKNLIILSFLVLPCIAWTQLIPVKGEQKPVTINQSIEPIDEVNDLPSVPLVKSLMDEPLGTTRYDFQTNASIMNRLINRGDGELTAVWTMGRDDPGFGDRGTGYNRRENGSWGEPPQGRVETVRTGWPSLVETEDGTELIVAHDFGQGTLVTSRRAAGETDWTQSVVPSDVPMGQLWAQMAAGEGNTVHLIAITSLGSTYEGVEGHLLYYRSPDAGLTWDVQDFIVPGLDSTNYMDFRQSDSYKIAARGNTVAISRFCIWEDVLVFRSDDNGDTWDRSVIYDFPIDQYVADTGYGPDQVPPDDFAPSALAIYSGGNSGNIVIDHDSNLHLFFSSLYVTDENLTDGELQYFPCTNGIAYWNETMGENSFRIVAQAVDADGSGFLDFDCLDPNFSHRLTSLTTAPNAGVDENNNLFLTYAAVTENYFSPTALPSLQHYRHIYATASLDGGETWSSPIDLIEETVDPVLLPMINADFPTVALDVDDRMHIIYQQDFEPGNIIADLDPAGDNTIIYLDVDVAQFGVVVSSLEVATPEQQLTLSPNPANAQTYLTINPSWSNQAVLTIHDNLGRQVFIDSDLKGNNNTYVMPTSGLASGVFFVQVIDKKTRYSGRLVVE